MIQVDLDAMRDLWSTLAQNMRDGSKVRDELANDLAEKKEALDGCEKEALRVERVAQERVDSCQQVYSRESGNLRAAEADLSRAQNQLSAAESALASCLSSPPYIDYSDPDNPVITPPDCSAEQMAVSSAQSDYFAAAAVFEQAQDRFEVAENALRQAELLLTQASEKAGEIRRFAEMYKENIREIERQIYAMTTLYNYEIPHLLGILGYKIGVLETEYLATYHGVGRFEIPSSHGYSYAKARREYLRDIAPYDYRIAAHIRQELEANISSAEAKDRFHIRSPIGMNTGHRFRGVNSAYNLRLEDADMNQSRGGRQGR